MDSLPKPRVTPLRGGPVLRWGVVGPGEIARDFTSTLHANTDQRVVAVGSRSAERADAFAATHGISRAYGSYEELVADPEIDVVYVATPHSEHPSQALLAIAAGKHVLVEKPFAVSRDEGERIVSAAREAGVFAMEAMWSRYLPQFDVIAQLIESGDLGDVRLATASVGWQTPEDPTSRMFDPALGGGTILDGGVYALWFAQFAIGRPSSVQALGSLASTGVDEQSVVALQSSPGRHAAVTISLTVPSPARATISGTRGDIRFEDSFLFPGSFVATVGDREFEWQDPSGLAGRDGLAWQAVALARFVADGRTESPLHGLDDTLALLETMDTIRRQIGAA